jgi:hypothetical protein
MKQLLLIALFAVSNLNARRIIIISDDMPFIRETTAGGRLGEVWGEAIGRFLR